MSEPLEMTRIDIQSCDPDCPCQSVHVLGVDADGEVFAAGCLDPDTAREFAQSILECADVADANKARITGRVQ